MILCGAIALKTWSGVNADTSLRGEWKSLVTEYTTINYRSLEDLKTFYQKIKHPSRGRFSSPSPSISVQDETPSGLIQKIDVLFKSAQKILSIRKKMNRVFLQIHSNKEQLALAYVKISGSSLRCYEDRCSLKTALPRAWYVYETNTVHLNVEDVHQGILAHEMAHAIIDHYLGFKPSRTTAERLAKGVEKNLPF